jgi:hypothetical protein
MGIYGEIGRWGERHIIRSYTEIATVLQIGNRRLIADEIISCPVNYPS